MDCDQVREILDAYVLGAADREEAHGLEEHVAECLACWDQLSEAQQVAAALALGVPLATASPRLRERVLASARTSLRCPSPWLPAIGSGFRRLWPAGVFALGSAAVALAAFLFLRMDNLGNENDQLRSQVVAASQLTDQLRQMEAIRSAPDVKSVALQAQPWAPEVVASFYWSEVTGRGALVCSKLAPLEPGQVYQLWLLFDGQAISAGTFTPWQGVGYLIFELGPLTEHPHAVGVSVEPEGGSPAPSSEMILLAPFPHDY